MPSPPKNVEPSPPFCVTTTPPPKVLYGMASIKRFRVSLMGDIFYILKILTV